MVHELFVSRLEQLHDGLQLSALPSARIFDMAQLTQTAMCWTVMSVLLRTRTRYA